MGAGSVVRLGGMSCGRRTKTQGRECGVLEAETMEPQRARWDADVGWVFEREWYCLTQRRLIKRIAKGTLVRPMSGTAQWASDWITCFPRLPY